MKNELPKAIKKYCSLERKDGGYSVVTISVQGGKVIKTEQTEQDVLAIALSHLSRKVREGVA